MPLPLPEPSTFSELTGLLLGKETSVRAGSPIPKNRRNAVATYIDKSRKILYATITDATFAITAGSALALLPDKVVKEALKAGAPTPTMLENAYEVLNVSASLFNEIKNTPIHVKIDKLKREGELPSAFLERLTRPAQRIDLVHSIPGYPDGNVTLLTFV